LTPKKTGSIKESLLEGLQVYNNIQINWGEAGSGENFHALSKWGMSFTDFRVSRKEATSSSEHRKKDIYFPSKKISSFLLNS
jgi:hypothetical protein